MENASSGHLARVQLFLFSAFDGRLICYNISEGSASTIVRSSRHDVAGVRYPSHSGHVSSTLVAYSADHTHAVLFLRDLPGKRNLAIAAGGTLFTADRGKVHGGKQIVGNIRDPSVADWLLPAITTTAEEHRIVASLNIMASSP